MSVGTPVLVTPTKSTVKLKIHTGAFSATGAPILRTESYRLRTNAADQDAKDFAIQLGSFLTTPESLSQVQRVNEGLLGE